MNRKAWEKYILTVGLTVLILMTNSCKITQPYRVPADATNNKLYRDAFITDTTNIANISWKQMFTDTLLQSMVQEGINNNLDLKIAVARIKGATANVKQSKLQLLPAFDATATATYQEVPSTVFGFPQAYLLEVTSSWEADVWGKLSSAKKAALASLLQSEAYKKAVQTQLVSDIVTNYYLLMAYDEQLRVTEKTVVNREREVETMKILKESNVVTGAAVVQSSANLYSVKITIPDLKQNIHDTENVISLLLGRTPDSIFRTSLEQQNITTN
ncbi:MAG TPA: TolC family protein, partial [Puia sp.]|nr:TolC family protein [Puia sp.]